jgi:hypothetical protein
MKELPQSNDKLELYPFLILIHNIQIFFSLTFVPIYKDNFMGHSWAYQTHTLESYF